MESFFRGIIRFRWLVITLVLGCTGLAWVQLGKLRFESDADAMLPPSDPVISYNDLVEDRFGIRDLIIIGVLNDNPGENGVFNPRTLGIVKEFSEQIARLPGIKAVRDEDVASIATLDNITGTVDGMAVRPFMDDVPHTAEALKALQQALFHNPMYVNWVVSQDSTGLLIMARMEPAGGTQEGLARRAAVYRTIRDMIAAKKAMGVLVDSSRDAGLGSKRIVTS